MAKKNRPLVAPRRPPPAVPPEVLENFIKGGEVETPVMSTDVHGRSETSVTSAPLSSIETVEAAVALEEQSREEVPAASLQTLPGTPEPLQTAGRQRGLVEREGGRLRRRRTVYLPPELDERLERWCEAQGREVSHAVAEAIRKMLGEQA